MLRKTFILIFISSSIYFSQDNNVNLLGNLGFDSHISFMETKDSLSSSDELLNQQKKSPILAGFLSALIPGSGQFYNKDYWKTAVFLAIEAAAITAGVIYDNKGDEQTGVFEDYANARWDAAKYAHWTIDNLENHLNPVLANDLKAEDYNDLFYDEEQTQVNWNVLNELERNLGGWYSHQLERFGEQQYYEMIGKYPQFNPGWDDFDENSDFTYTNQREDPVTDNFNYYSDQRGQANEYYDMASAAVNVIVINHILSAAEAVWSASRFNKRLKIKMSVQREIIGANSIYYPQLNIRYNF